MHIQKHSRYMLLKPMRKATLHLSPLEKTLNLEALWQGIRSLGWILPAFHCAEQCWVDGEFQLNALVT